MKENGLLNEEQNRVSKVIISITLADGQLVDGVNQYLMREDIFRLLQSKGIAAEKISISCESSIHIKKGGEDHSVVG